MRIRNRRDLIALVLIVVAIIGLWLLGARWGAAAPKAEAARTFKLLERQRDRTQILSDGLAAEKKAHAETSETVEYLEKQAEEASDTILELKLELYRTKEDLEKARVRAKNQASVSAGGWRRAVASWYGPGLYGNTMAGGGILTQSSMVVAHRSLPFGTRVQIRYNGRVASAVVQDRGPYVSGRTFDLGPGVRAALGFSGEQTIEWRVI